MNKIPYCVKRITTDQLRRVDEFSLSLMQDSAEQPYELKQIVPIQDGNETYELFAVYAMNYNLICTELWIDEDTCDEKYLTADQIELIKKIGFIDVNGESREIENVTFYWRDDVYNVYASITLK